MMSGKVKLNIGSMAFKGYGVARFHRKVVFIPYSVTGDEVWVEIIEEKRNYSMGRLKKIIVPSPWRVDPPCPYFGLCGGCQWQHIDYSIQGELKKEILKEVLKRIGGQKEIPSITMASSTDPYGYRARIQLKGNEKAMGYYQERSHHIVDIDHCPISHPLVNQMILLLRRELPLFSRMKEIEINVSPEEGKGVLILHPLSFHQGLENFLKEYLQTHPILKGIAIIRKGGPTLLGNPLLNFTIPLNQYGGKRNLKLRTSPESFFQVNLKQNQTLVQMVFQFSDVKEDERVLDLYAGVGNLTLPLAIKAKEIFGVEENRMAVEDARFNAKENRIKNCEWIHGRVEDVLKRWSGERPNLVVLDPPRTGCKTILDQVVRLKPEKIVYVSCEPTRLSRDLRLFFESGYDLQRLGFIDMFPQTYHMEVVALLKSLC
jgi:23S rRNA (uracil1939-C5)-methyltransferase